MHIIKSSLLYKILAGQPTSVFQKQNFLILCTGKLRHGGRAFWQQLPHGISTRSTPCPGLGFRSQITIGKLLYQAPETSKPNPTNDRICLTKPLRQNKGADSEWSSWFLALESSFGYCIWTVQTETQCSAAKYFLFWQLTILFQRHMWNTFLGNLGVKWARW